MYDLTLWQPSANNETLQKRAALLRNIREFFWQQGVMEVDTQALSLASITDPHIETLTTTAKCLSKEQTYYLQTSPEFAMKRLLAAGSGDIYQLGKVFRREEQSHIHSIEFTMLEWYRLGFDHWQLMYEVEALLAYLTGKGGLQCQFKSYQEAFLLYVGVDPFTASLDELQQLTHKHSEFGLLETDRDTLLNLLFSTVIEVNIGLEQPCFIHSYPASQAALAKTYKNESGHDVAARFELYWQGMELANGYHELTDPKENANRMVKELQERQNANKAGRQHDERLLEALKSGLPEAAGVALGVDRLLMIMLSVENIEEVMPFATNRV